MSFHIFGLSPKYFFKNFIFSCYFTANLADVEYLAIQTDHLQYVSVYRVYSLLHQYVSAHALRYPTHVIHEPSKCGV